MPTRVLLPILLLAGIVYFIAYATAPFLQPDSIGYARTAADLSDGQLEAVSMRAPAYPFLVLLTNSYVTPSRLLVAVQLVLMLAGIFSLMQILKAAEVARWMQAAALLILLSPPFMEYAAWMLTDGFAFSMISIGFAVLILAKGQLWSGGAAGILFSLAALSRPAYLLLGLVFGAYLFVLRRERMRGLSVAVGSLLLVIAFSLFNRAQTGYLGVTPALGWNMTTKTADLLDELPPSAFRDLVLETRNDELVNGESHTGAMAIWNMDEADLIEAAGVSDRVEFSNYLLRMNLSLIAANPLEYIGEVLESAGNYWMPFITREGFFGIRPLQIVFAGTQFALAAAFFITAAVTLGILVTVGLRHLPRSLTLPFNLAVIAVLYTMAITITVDIGNPRHRMSAEGLVVIAVFTGIMIWWRTRQTFALKTGQPTLEAAKRAS